ncbi:hypothetical protein N9Q07_00855 [Alphaproteobacteria bacterium]|nr:hypothetical protein [Alphaproteobacteria bacterium]
MKSSLLIIFISMLLSSCAAIEARKQARKDSYEKTCTERGLKKGTGEYSNCIDMQELKRRGKINTYYNIINRK